MTNVDILSNYAIPSTSLGLTLQGLKLSCSGDFDVSSGWLHDTGHIVIDLSDLAINGLDLNFTNYPTKDNSIIPKSVNVVQDKEYFNIGNLNLTLSNTAGGGLINFIIDLIKSPLEIYISSQITTLIKTAIDTNLSPELANLWDFINNGFKFKKG